MLIATGTKLRKGVPRHSCGAAKAGHGNALYYGAQRDAITLSAEPPGRCGSRIVLANHPWSALAWAHDRARARHRPFDLDWRLAPRPAPGQPAAARRIGDA